jgi:hypothetical protein
MGRMTEKEILAKIEEVKQLWYDGKITAKMRERGLETLNKLLEKIQKIKDRYK